MCGKVCTPKDKGKEKKQGKDRRAHTKGKDGVANPALSSSQGKRRSKAKTQRKGRDESETCELCNCALTRNTHIEIKYLKAKVWEGVHTKGQREREEARQRHREREEMKVKPVNFATAP